MNKRTALIIGLAIVLVGGIVYAGRNYKRESTYLVAESATEAQRELLTKDSDSDGLKDWEEELWKTNAYDADTDRDGTPDTEEIRSGRDPLKAGPNDKLDEATIEAKINPEIEADLSRTDKFSRELFARYARARNAGDATLDDYFEVLYKNLQDELETTPPAYYSASDIKVIYTENKALFREYGNNVGTIFTQPTKQRLEHELTILERVTNGNPDDVKDFEPLEQEYDRIKNQLLLIEVPDNLLTIHLALLNAVAGVQEGIQGMQQVISDPVKAAAEMHRYPEAAETLPTSLKAIAEFMREEGITFKQSERGYLFSAGI